MRTKPTTTAALILAGMLGCHSRSGGTGEPASSAPPRITQHASSEAGILANAYLVENDDGVVVIDATLTVDEATALRGRVEATGKPLLAILLTHGHPDHYNGAEILGQGLVPIVSTAAVDEIVRRDDAAKEALWTPVFGEQWPTPRAFPTEHVADGETVTYGGMNFTVHAMGPSESHADSYWTLDGGSPAAFVGDLTFNGTHAYVTDGHTTQWLASLDRLDAELPADAVLYPGHGPVGDKSLVGAQRAYLEAYRSELAELIATHGEVNDEVRAALTEAMDEYLGSKQLDFLVGLGADAVAAEL